MPSTIALWILEVYVRFQAKSTREFKIVESAAASGVATRRKIPMTPE
jgi:hypothetical protein